MQTAPSTQAKPFKTLNAPLLRVEPNKYKGMGRIYTYSQVTVLYLWSTHES